jgi:transcriptional regulator with XRE-family HTH domain
VPEQTSTHVALGRAIRDLRARRGLTQAQLAEASGFARKTIYQMECGIRDIRFGTLLRVAAALDVRLDVRMVDLLLVSGEEPAARTPQARRGSTAA